MATPPKKSRSHWLSWFGRQEEITSNESTREQTISEIAIRAEQLEKKIIAFDEKLRLDAQDMKERIDKLDRSGDEITSNESTREQTISEIAIRAEQLEKKIIAFEEKLRLDAQDMKERIDQLDRSRDETMREILTYLSGTR
jgi:tetrahydromethanopterin S-methyltransferase subunit B